MLGAVLKNESVALTALNEIKQAGYDGMELNGSVI